MCLENEYIYNIQNEVADLNQDNILKPYGYQKLIAKVAEQHLLNINLDIDTIKKTNLAWVLVSLTVEVQKNVEGCINMVGKTWYSQRKGPFFRREMEFKNENGELLFSSSAFSVLLDINTRKIFTKKELPFKLLKPEGEFLTKAHPTYKTSAEFTKIQDRTVYNSYLDCLGHVNNCRYGEFAYDVLSNEEIKNYKNLKKMEVYFLSELRLNDNFNLQKAYQDNKILIKGNNNTKKDTSFNIAFTFDK